MTYRYYTATLNRIGVPANIGIRIVEFTTQFYWCHSEMVFCETIGQAHALPRYNIINVAFQYDSAYSCRHLTDKR